MATEYIKRGNGKPIAGGLDASFKEKQDQLIKENEKLRAELEKTNSAINLLIGGEVEK